MDAYKPDPDVGAAQLTLGSRGEEVRRTFPEDVRIRFYLGSSWIDVDIVDGALVIRTDINHVPAIRPRVSNVITVRAERT